MTDRQMDREGQLGVGGREGEGEGKKKGRERE